MTANATPGKWTLWSRGALLGTLTKDSSDQPSLFCRFQPTNAFDEVRPYFEAQARHIENEDYDELEHIQEQIEALGLELRRVPDGVLLDVSSLIIDGDSAEFIPIPAAHGP